VSKTPTKAEKKRIMDSVPTRTLTDKEFAEVQGMTHSEYRRRDMKSFKDLKEGLAPWAQKADKKPKYKKVFSLKKGKVQVNVYKYDDGELKALFTGNGETSTSLKDNKVDKKKLSQQLQSFAKSGKLGEETTEEGWKKKKKNEDCGLDHDTMKKKKMKKHMDDVHEDEDLEEDYFTVQYYNGNKNAVDDKFKNFKSKAQADKYAKKGNKVDRVGGEYKVFKVKGVMESVELEEKVSLSKKGNYEVSADGKSSVGIRIGLYFKGKLIVPGTKQKGLFVMGFDKADGKHKLPPGATIVKDSGKYLHIGFKKVNDIIAYAMLENITDEVTFKEEKSFKSLRKTTK
jgi:hypothetical protein